MKQRIGIVLDVLEATDTGIAHDRGTAAGFERSERHPARTTGKIGTIEAVIGGELVADLSPEEGGFISGDCQVSHRLAGRFQHCGASGDTI